MMAFRGALRAPAWRALVSGASRPAVFPRRALASAQESVRDDDSAWAASFVAATDHLSGESSHEESAAHLRALVRSGLLTHTDLRDNPSRFFLAHRLLAERAVEHGPGFWIRFTVHYNLCFGTVLAVGGPEQIGAMAAVEAEGKLGCFALTEKLAGVQSGLVVRTTAEYDAASDEFVLTTPDEGSQKNWISQGHVADSAVVLADLSVGGKREGPHAFVVDLKAEGVSTGDMGPKTTGNDLDNAWIAFDKVRVPNESLLDAHCGVVDGEYVLKSENVKPFEMIGQRLYTGRVAVAQAALVFRRRLFDVTRAYADAKPIPAVAGGQDPPLSGIPQLKALFAEAENTAGALEAFVDACEEKLTPHLAASTPPSDELAHEIACAKVRAVEHATDLCWRLKQEVGSYALMKSSAFAHLDFLSCCKFAEGDSRILMQKMARDAVRALSKGTVPADAAEARLCADLAAALAPAGKDKAAAAALWDENWELVYALAEAIMDRTIADALAE